MGEAWRRHDLLRIKPSVWARVSSRQPQVAALPEIVNWATLGRPLIVRRRTPKDEGGTIPTAISLPAGWSQRRVAVQVFPEEISERVQGATLRAAHRATPVSWQATVAHLLDLANESGVEPRIFGSLLWQQLTGLSYLSATSDLDLLWPIRGPKCVTRLVSRLAAIEANSPMRLDGELLLPDGGGVNWRELYDGASKVLVKTMSGVELRRVKTLFQDSADKNNGTSIEAKPSN